MTVTARSTGGSEVRLRREVQTVAVPVFQFGIFGEKSLSFHAGANFDFGGRVHTNTHLFLAQGSGDTLTFTRQADRGRAGGALGAGEHRADHQRAPTPAPVSVPTVIGSTCRNLGLQRGQRRSTGPAAAFVAGWKNLSEVTYNTNIRNYDDRCEAARSAAGVAGRGADRPDPPARCCVERERRQLSRCSCQRYFAQASLRILLSDRAADITGCRPSRPGRRSS